MAATPHRVGISNHRIQTFDDSGVRFATKDGQSVTIAPLEFIRRYLDHVLPRGFNKIRHFGLYAASNIRTKLSLARKLLTATRVEPEHQSQPELNAASTIAEVTTTWQELVLRLTGVDPRRCPSCGCGLVRSALPQPAPSYMDTS